jgi:hypothetical protein
MVLVSRSLYYLEWVKCFLIQMWWICFRLRSFINKTIKVLLAGNLRKFRTLAEIWYYLRTKQQFSSAKIRNLFLFKKSCCRMGTEFSNLWSNSHEPWKLSQRFHVLYFNLIFISTIYRITSNFCSILQSNPDRRNKNHRILCKIDV